MFSCVSLCPAAPTLALSPGPFLTQQHISSLPTTTTCATGLAPVQAHQARSTATMGSCTVSLHKGVQPRRQMGAKNQLILHSPNTLFTWRWGTFSQFPLPSGQATYLGHNIHPEAPVDQQCSGRSSPTGFQAGVGAGAPFPPTERVCHLPPHTGQEGRGWDCGFRLFSPQPGGPVDPAQSPPGSLAQPPPPLSVLCTNPLSLGESWLLPDHCWPPLPLRMPEAPSLPACSSQKGDRAWSCMEAWFLLGPWGGDALSQLFSEQPPGARALGHPSWRGRVRSQ